MSWALGLMTHLNCLWIAGPHQGYDGHGSHTALAATDWVVRLLIRMICIDKSANTSNGWVHPYIPDFCVPWTFWASLKPVGSWGTSQVTMMTSVDASCIAPDIAENFQGQDPIKFPITIDLGDSDIASVVYKGSASQVQAANVTGLEGLPIKSARNVVNREPSQDLKVNLNAVYHDGTARD
ncbi:hypothetical protein HD554DRAFT_2040070 [Boletus coccyginus]|nr:hypothetical protein HD554DRAFT_2040070 [Boletus coccyginus]